MNPRAGLCVGETVVRPHSVGESQRSAHAAAAELTRADATLLTTPLSLSLSLAPHRDVAASDSSVQMAASKALGTTRPHRTRLPDRSPW